MLATADEVHFPRTADGWRLALHRRHPLPGGSGFPVILCAGYACNRHFLDYDERYSLARFLARAGFDSWVLELRGRGMAHPEPGMGASWTWTFDDLAAFDVPAAIDYVASVTGRPVMWVGHSMGGMLLYAYCGRVAPSLGPLCAGITMASPVAFPGSAPELLSRLGLFLLSVPLTETIHQRWVLGALWGLLGRSSVVSVGMNPGNIDRNAVGRALRLSLENVSRAKLQQFAQWSQRGEFCSVDGRIDYREALADVTLPLFVIAGAADRIATPEAVAAALRHLPTTGAHYIELSRANGHAADYGHVDIVLGRAAPDDVFPKIARWLESQARNGLGTSAAGKANGNVSTAV